MIIYTNVPPKKIDKTSKKVEEQIDNEVVVKSAKTGKKKNKKITSTPLIIEEPIVVEEKTEDEDLSQWLEEHTED